MPSKYAAKERARGIELASSVHNLSLELGRCLIVQVTYKAELASIPDGYLPERVRIALGSSPAVWDDALSRGLVRELNWELPRRVLARDDVYYGGSRMIELLLGSYDHQADYSMAAKWRPSPRHPLFAEAVYQASVVQWFSRSPEAVDRKASQFKSVLAKAERQLPSDRPGVVHVGIDSSTGAEVAEFRNVKNWLVTRTFSLTESHLRWVYATYLVPEATTHPNETWAIVETTRPFKIGYHKVPWPLPNHLVVVGDKQTDPGVFWDGRYGR